MEQRVFEHAEIDIGYQDLDTDTPQTVGYTLLLMALSILALQQF